MYTVKGTTLHEADDGPETALMTKYDAPPYVQSADSGSFPFVDIGNKYLVIGSQYLPSSLAKLTWAQVAAAIRNPSSPVATGRRRRRERHHRRDLQDYQDRSGGRLHLGRCRLRAGSL